MQICLPAIALATVGANLWITLCFYKDISACFGIVKRNKLKRIFSYMPMKLRFILLSLLLSFSQIACAKDNSGKVQLNIDDRPVAKNVNGLPTSYADPLEKATPSIVSVYTKTIQRIVRGGVDPREEALRRLFGFPPSPNQQAPREEEQSRPLGMGSGVIVSSDGYILTNNHVVSDQRGDIADEVTVKLQDGRELPAEVIGRDPQTDVAVIKIDAQDLPAITFANSDNLRVGDIVFAIGNPLGVGITVSSGIVSALGRADLGILGRGGYENFIQVDAPINMGNSGGALVDAEGRLIGINTAISSMNGGSIGIGFAIPVNLASRVMSSLVETGEVARGYLGVFPKDLTPDLAEAFGVETTTGALIDFVENDTPADQYGLKAGDIVKKVNGKSVTSASQFRVLISQNLPGSEVTLSIIREKKSKEITVVLGSLNGKIAQNGSSPQGSDVEGLTVKSLTPELREQFEVSDRIKEGVVITAIRDSKLGESLQVGMVIIRLNDREITSPAEFTSALQKGLNKAYYSLGTYTGFLTFRVE